MSDPSLFGDWFGRGLSTVVGAVLAAGTTVFATRKNNEASVLDAVNSRITDMFERQDGEIERLERMLREDRADCDRQLHALRVEIAKLMGNPPPIPPYTANDIDKGRKTVGDALARRKGKAP